MEQLFTPKIYKYQKLRHENHNQTGIHYYSVMNQLIICLYVIGLIAKVLNE